VLSIDFKTQIPQTHESIAVACVAFANWRGGRMLVKVDDNCLLDSIVEGARE
jgi:hypothetical protein